MKLSKNKIEIFFLLAFAVLIFSGCTVTQETSKDQKQTQQNRDTALEYFLKGITYDQKGDYASAILEYQDALRHYEDAAIYYALAKSYSKLGKHALAVQMGKEAIRLDTTNFHYYETLAEMYLRAMDIDSAARIYEDIIRRDSSYKQAWYNLAQILQFNKPLKASEVFELIILRFGPSLDIYSQLVQLYSLLDKPDKVLQTLHRMLELDANNIDVKKIMAENYLRLDSLDSAQRLYEELIELNPNDLFLRVSLINVYLAKKAYYEAVEQFDDIVRQNLTTADEKIQVGQLFLSYLQGDSAVLSFARDVFVKIQRQHADDWRPYRYLGSLASMMQDDSAAIEYFKTTTVLARENPDGWVGLASVWFDKGEYSKTVEILKEAEQFVTDAYRIYYLLGIAYNRLKKTDESIIALEKALQLNDKDVDVFAALALIYDELKIYEKSDSLYERAMRIAPNDHLILNNFGYSLADRGIQLERALEMAKEAVRQQPQNSSYLDTIGWVYFRLARYEEAREYIQKAIDLGTKSAVIYEHMGDVYSKLNQKDKAIDYWLKAFELDNTNEALKFKIEKGSL